jgi:hypothetical protein
MQQHFSWQRFKLIGVRYYVLPVVAVNLEIRFQNMIGEIFNHFGNVGFADSGSVAINSGKI